MITTIFRCDTCAEKPEFKDVPEVKKHLTEVHKVTEFKGTKSLHLHLATADGQHLTYEWNVGGVVFYQMSVSDKRPYGEQGK